MYSREICAYYPNQSEFLSNFGICKCKSRFALLSLKEMQDVALSFKYCRLSSPQVYFVAPYYLLILSFCILSWIEVQQQQSRYYTSCCFCCCSKTVSSTLGVWIDINSYCCLSPRKKLILFHPWQELTKVTGLRSQLFHAWGFCHKIPNITNLQKKSLKTPPRITFLSYLRYPLLSFTSLGSWSSRK